MNTWPLYKDSSHGRPRANSTSGFLLFSLMKILPIKIKKQNQNKGTLKLRDQFKGHHLTQPVNKTKICHKHYFFHLLF